MGRGDIGARTYPLSRYVASALAVTMSLLTVTSVIMMGVGIEQEGMFLTNVRGKFGGRKLLQGTPIPLNPLVLPLLNPLVPINYGFLNGDLTFFNVNDPVATAELALLSNLLTLTGLKVQAFGDFPIIQLIIPEFDLLGGGVVSLTEGEVEAGSILASLNAWVQGNIFDFSADWPLVSANIFKTFGFDELGFPVGFENLFNPPYDFDGILNIHLIEESFISVLRKLITGEYKLTQPVIDLWRLFARTFNIPPIYGIRVDGTY